MFLDSSCTYSPSWSHNDYSSYNGSCDKPFYLKLLLILFETIVLLTAASLSSRKYCEPCTCRLPIDSFAFVAELRVTRFACSYVCYTEVIVRVTRFACSYVCYTEVIVLWFCRISRLLELHFLLAPWPHLHWWQFGSRLLLLKDAFDRDVSEKLILYSN